MDEKRILEAAKRIFKVHGMFPLDDFESLSEYEQNRYKQMAEAALKEK